MSQISCTNKIKEKIPASNKSYGDFLNNYNSKAKTKINQELKKGPKVESKYKIL